MVNTFYDENKITFVSTKSNYFIVVLYCGEILETYRFVDNKKINVSTTEAFEFFFNNEYETFVKIYKMLDSNSYEHSNVSSIITSVLHNLETVKDYKINELIEIKNKIYGKLMGLRTNLRKIGEDRDIILVKDNKVVIKGGKKIICEVCDNILEIESGTITKINNVEYTNDHKTLYTILEKVLKNNTDNFAYIYYKLTNTSQIKIANKVLDDIISHIENEFNEKKEKLLIVNNKEKKKKILKTNN